MRLQNRLSQTCAALSHETAPGQCGKIIYATVCMDGLVTVCTLLSALLCPHFFSPVRAYGLLLLEPYVATIHVCA